MTPVGYRSGDDAYCTDCVPEGISLLGDVILADDEADAPTHCNTCEVIIEHSLTSDGLEYVADHIRDHMEARLSGEQSGRAPILRQWWESYADGAFPALWHDDLLKAMLEDYFLSVPTVDEHSPTYAKELASIHGMYPHRHAVVDFTNARIVGPFVSRLAAGTVAGSYVDKGRQATSMALYLPGESKP